MSVSAENMKKRHNYEHAIQLMKIFFSRNIELKGTVNPHVLRNIITSLELAGDYIPNYENIKDTLSTLIIMKNTIAKDIDLFITIKNSRLHREIAAIMEYDIDPHSKQNIDSSSSSSSTALTTAFNIENNALNLTKSPSKKLALVIGARREVQMDKIRYDAFFKKDIEWTTLNSDHDIERSLKIPPTATLEELQKNPIKVLEEIIQMYQKNYSEYFELLPFYDFIMVDRATTHCLIIDNPFIQEGKPYWDLVTNKFLTGMIGNVGFINQAVLCLLFLKMCEHLKPEGSLIFDARDIDYELIKLIEPYFEKNETFDYNSRENLCLSFGEAYKNHEKPPLFLKFCNFIGKKIDFEAFLKDLKSKISVETTAKKPTPL